MWDLKAHIQLLLGQIELSGREKKESFPFTLINILNKMNVKWESLQRGLCIIIYLLAEVKNNETILSFKASLEKYVCRKALQSKNYYKALTYSNLLEETAVIYAGSSSLPQERSLRTLAINLSPHLRGCY